jgi:hypothetical protein
MNHVIIIIINMDAGEKSVQILMLRLPVLDAS